MKKYIIILAIFLAGINFASASWLDDFFNFFKPRQTTTLGVGVFQPFQGGTGINTIPTYGQILVGNSGGTYTLTATSSLGISGGAGTIDGSGSANTLTYWTDADTIAATSSPTVGYITATSTTATSTFAGGLNVESGGLVYDYSTNKVGIGTNAPNSQLSIKGLSTEPTYASNLITNGDFATGDFTGWTAGANWSIASNAALHTTGSVETLSQTISVTNATKYQIEWTDTGGTAGTYTLDIGGVVSRAYNYWESAGAKRTTIIASGSGSQTFTITPSSTYDGSIDNITVRAVSTNASAIVEVQHTDGTKALEIRSGGTTLQNTFVGLNTGQNNTTGYQNTAIGAYSLNTNTTGYANTANGYSALISNTTGHTNVANGYFSLYTNTVGYSNTANGVYALRFNTTGYQNTANGYGSLYNNTTGYNNTANGANSLRLNTTGNANTANGYGSLYSNTTGYSNVANGYQSLYYNTTGYANTANGVSSLYSNTTGYQNMANGSNSLFSNTTGNDNTANGYYSLYNNTTGYNNVANGNYSFRYNTTGAGNVGLGLRSGVGDGTTVDQRSVIDNYATFLGYQASRDASVASASALTNITAIGKNARVGASNTIVLGGTGADAVNVGISTSTPWSKLSIGSGGAITVGENTLATSSSMTISWNNGNQQLVRIGTAAMTISFSDYIEGQTLKVIACNPASGTAGTITWGTEILWSGGVQPGQTTTANKCDVWSFLSTMGTSTIKIFGGVSSSF